MNISRIVSKTKKVVSDNSPLILTAVGVAGTITTAYLAAKASFRASEVLRDEALTRENKLVLEADPNDPAPVIVRNLTKKEKFDLLWKLYIPAVTTGVVTCTSIVFANRITTKRAAALATAYSLSERAYAEYRDKVVEKLGKEEEAEVRKEVAQARVNAAPPSGEIFINEVDGVLCHDAYSGRYFKSSKNAIEAARNAINYDILKSDYATLTSFWDKIGLPQTSGSDEMGWNSERPLELGWSTVESPDGKPCLSYDFVVVPIRDPWRFQ
jgi:hypothetical protein